MRRMALFVGLSLLVGTQAFAGPKDKTSETLINPDSIAGNGSWNNKTVSTKVKAGKCKVQIQFKDATGVANQDLVCLAEADVRATSLGAGIFGNSVVISGTVGGDGKFKVKANLGSIGCGILSEAVSFNGSMTCYQATVGTGGGEYNWSSECLASGMLPLAANVTPGTEDVKAGATVGICQGLVNTGGQRINPPSGTPLLVQGTYQPLG